MSVSEDGTLVIEPVVMEDAGEYVCKGLSVAGSAYAKARLEVKGESYGCGGNSHEAMYCLRLRIVYLYFKLFMLLVSFMF